MSYPLAVAYWGDLACQAMAFFLAVHTVHPLAAIFGESTPEYRYASYVTHYSMPHRILLLVVLHDSVAENPIHNDASSELEYSATNEVLLYRQSYFVVPEILVALNAG